MPVKPVREMTYDQLRVSVFPDNPTLGQAAAEAAASVIKQAVAERGFANVVVATGNSQLTFMRAVREMKDIPWPAVNVFHMDEYLNLPPGHPAGFPLFLRRNIIDYVPVAAFYPVPGHPADVDLACRAYEMLLRAHPIDLCVLGIGENGHVAFNDPPVADFDDPVWVKVVELEERCRRQQVGEGHFKTLDEVPTHAVTLTIPALRSAKQMLCLVPEQRKAEAVRNTLLGPISTACPASILRRTPHCRLFLDRESASSLL